MYKLPLLSQVLVTSPEFPPFKLYESMTLVLIFTLVKGFEPEFSGLSFISIFAIFMGTKEGEEPSPPETVVSKI